MCAEQVHTCSSTSYTCPGCQVENTTDSGSHRKLLSAFVVAADLLFGLPPTLEPTPKRGRLSSGSMTTSFRLGGIMYENRGLRWNASFCFMLLITLRSTSHWSPVRSHSLVAHSLCCRMYSAQTSGNR